MGCIRPPRKLLVWTVSLFGTGMLCTAAEPIRFEVHAGEQIEVSPTMYGLFFEEINHAGDGGIYAEMVQNRTFEELRKPKGFRIDDGRWVTPTGWTSPPLRPKSTLHAWSVVADNGAQVRISPDESNPLNAHRTTSMKVEVLNAAGRAGVSNEGYWGMSVVEGEYYNLSFYARGEKSVSLLATLESADGSRVYASAPIEYVGGNWRKYQCRLRAGDTDPKARLVIAIAEPTTMWLDVVSLFPENTFKNRPNGLRRDLMEVLKDMRPTFLRFPGGCVVEGLSLDNRFIWHQTIGDIAERPGHWNLWGYRSTDGLGFLEYLQMAEDLDAEIMYVVNVGISCQAREAEFAPDVETIIQLYLQETLDALEYAMGDANTTWGALRATHGRVEPFKIKYVEIGNENSGDAYLRAYSLFYAAIKAKYPEIVTIANQSSSRQGYPIELYDEHYYADPTWFFDNADRYDTYDRNGPKIYVGEYAVNQRVGDGNFLGALAESAFMIGMERNADHVVMTSYAPLFENVHDRFWPVNLIRFDSSRVAGRSSYYVQKLFSQHVPTVILGSQLSNVPTVTPEPKGKIGLRTYLTDAEFKDIRVTANDRLIYSDDFGSGATSWDPKSGHWTMSNGAYRQTDTHATNATALVGDMSWEDYTLELKARKNAGKEGFIILFRYNDDHHLQWNLGGWGNTRHVIQAPEEIVAEAPGTIEEDRWYDIKIVLNGHMVSCYLDGKRIHQIELKLEGPRLFANAGYDRETGELVIKLCNATENVMPVEIGLSGLHSIGSKGTQIRLSADPLSENTLDEPKRIHPNTSTFDGVTDRFTFPAEAWSLNVLRIKADM